MARREDARYRIKTKEKRAHALFSIKKNQNFSNFFFQKGLDIHRVLVYNIYSQGGNPKTKTQGRKEKAMEEGMNNQQLDKFLENIAKLIESTAKTPQEAAEIVRDSKIHR